MSVRVSIVKDMATLRARRADWDAPERAGNQPAVCDAAVARCVVDEVSAKTARP